MTAKILDGKALAKNLRARLVEEREALNEQGVVPRITAVLVTGDDASSYYVKSQASAAKKIGIEYDLIELPGDVSEQDLTDQITSLNNDDSVTGMILLVPLPDHLNDSKFQRMISPKKDVEGIHVQNLGELVCGGDDLVPCTARAAVEMLLDSEVEIEGKKAVVVGRSTIVGKPLSMMMLNRNATVTICHSRTKDLPSICAEADILLCAVGAKAGMINAEWVKPGAIVVDIAIISKPEGGITGDVDFESVSEVAGAISPVPGGVGPVTSVMLMRNAIVAAKLQAAASVALNK